MARAVPCCHTAVLRAQEVIEERAGEDARLLQVFDPGGRVPYEIGGISQIELGLDIRTDVSIACNGSSPTGNMQGRLASAKVIAPKADAIASGDQTVPFKHVGDIKPPACDPKTDPTCK